MGSNPAAPIFSLACFSKLQLLELGSLIRGFSDRFIRLAHSLFISSPPCDFSLSSLLQFSLLPLAIWSTCIKSMHRIKS